MRQFGGGTGWKGLVSDILFLRILYFKLNGRNKYISWICVCVCVWSLPDIADHSKTCFFLQETCHKNILMLMVVKKNMNFKYSYIIRVVFLSLFLNYHGSIFGFYYLMCGKLMCQSTLERGERRWWLGCFNLFYYYHASLLQKS